MYGLGTGVGKGFLKGLKDSLHDIDSIMGKIIKQLIAKLKRELKIKSPSEVMAEMGAEIPRGLAVGIGRGQRDVDRAWGSVTGGMRVAGQRPAAIGSYGQHHGCQPIQVYLGGPKLPTPEQLHAMSLSLTHSRRERLPAAGGLMTLSPPQPCQPGELYDLFFSFYDYETGTLTNVAGLTLDITYGGQVGLVPDIAGPFVFGGAVVPGPEHDLADRHRAVRVPVGCPRHRHPARRLRRELVVRVRV